MASTTPSMPFDIKSSSLARSVGFGLLGDQLARDVHTTLRKALKEGVVFGTDSTPLAIFRNTVATAIGRIQEDGRAPLFLRFLRDGPYEDIGRIPDHLKDQRVADSDVSRVIAYIYSHMVNCFKGAIAELLAVRPCVDILRTLQAEGRLSKGARLYVGDAVLTRQLRRGSFAKGADLHILETTREGAPWTTLGGVVEVKSYFLSQERLRRQIDRHVSRVGLGVRIGSHTYSSQHVQIGTSDEGGPARVSVTPAHWRLPRAFRFEESEGNRRLLTDPPAVPPDNDSLHRIGPWEWQVTLRWSKEGLDEAGFAMTFWFMHKLGEALYADGAPKEWSEMSSAEAGANAAKMMLYYALLRCRNSKEEQRAVALYNTYCFGYALGMNFRNAQGRREMLWSKDLDQILASGKTARGCMIR
jgi:hypothetical protein